jgi:FlaA1/EpsC-like NDP-sugar epimerase
MKSIVIIIGARPNFIKAFPVYQALKDDFKLTLIHTGQHFDEKMSKVFFEQLKFPRPDIHLSLEKKTKAGDYDERLYVNNKDFLANKDNAINELINYTEDLGQLGEIRDKLVIEFDRLVPDLVMVFGDVTSTLAAGLAAKKLKIELAHVESGLRSWDMAMPEEVNRILTDHITKYYFVTEQSGVDNLNACGINENVHILNYNMKNIFNLSDNNILEKNEYISINNVNLIKLLERDPIIVNNKDTINFLSNKKIIITGGCGSIGSEIIIQLLTLGINNLFLIDNCEFGHYSLKIKIKRLFPTINIKFFLRDIRNKDEINKIFSVVNPEIVFHVAAYKHVPIMEDNPCEAISTNVIGVKNIADLSIKHNVEKFLFVSTDKAVNPTNIMGASKRISELYVLECQKHSETDFVITRFGNVLGSSGSVIPVFIDSINNNCNLELTDKDVTRYFMSIPEAASLVIKAVTIGNGGEILLFNMGNPVKIIDLAKKILNLSSKKLSINITGLRPGEKLYEELLCNEEEIIPTKEKKIMVLKNNEEPSNFNYNYNKLINQYNIMSDKELRDNIKLLVPTYIYTP